MLKLTTCLSLTTAINCARARYGLSCSIARKFQRPGTNSDTRKPFDSIVGGW